MKKDRESLRDTMKIMFSLTEDVASHDEIRERLLDGGKITGTNMCVLICAMVIASVGLNTGSTAVIIGAADTKNQRDQSDRLETKKNSYDQEYSPGSYFFHLFSGKTWRLI